MAFIAGMAVMLAVLLPWLPKDKPVSLVLAGPHSAIAVPPGTSMQNCAACHMTKPVAGP